MPRDQDEGYVREHAALIERWFERSDAVLLLVVSENGVVVRGNRSFYRRSGRDEREPIPLSALLETAPGKLGELLISPPFRPPVQQDLMSVGDGSRWRCAVFERPEGGTIIVGSLLDDDRQGPSAHLVADVVELQRALQRDKRQIEAVAQEMTELARTDALTGVASRRMLDAALTAANAGGSEDADAPAEAKSLIVCDLDHFKSINDEFGHAVGDKVLKGVGQVLSEETRPTDLVARHGGEEFVVLMSGGSSAARRVADRIRQAIRATEFSEVDRAVTASFGVAERQPAEPVEEWFERADRALYRAKQSGRDRVVIDEDAAE